MFYEQCIKRRLGFGLVVVFLFPDYTTPITPTTVAAMEATGMEEDKRLGFIGIVINDRAVAGEVNTTLGPYARVIKARVGVPDTDSPAAVIGLIVEGSNQELGALTAKLGNLRGVEVKSALSKKAHSSNDP